MVREEIRARTAMTKNTAVIQGQGAMTEEARAARMVTEKSARVRAAIGKKPRARMAREGNRGSFQWPGRREEEARAG